MVNSDAGRALAAEQLTDGMRDREAIQENYGDLLTTYPDSFIAFYHGELIAYAATVEELVDMISGKGLSMREVAWEYMATQKPITTDGASVWS